MNKDEVFLAYDHECPVCDAYRRKVSIEMRITMKIHSLKKPRGLVRATFRSGLALAVLLLGILACNLPALNPASITPVDTLAAESAAATAPTAEFPEALDPLMILDSYPSLAGTRQRLDQMTFTLAAGGGTALTGRQLLEWILVERKYDPRAGNRVKQELFSELDKYTWPHPGAKIYLINVAAGLFAEAHHLYAWSLRDYSPLQIEDLFIQDDSLRRQSSGLFRGDLPPGMPNTESHWYLTPDSIIEDAHLKQFNLALRITQGAATQEQAVLSVMTWMMQNFFHAYAPGYGWEVYLDGRAPLNTGGPVAYPLSLDRLYEERVSGCHEPTIMMEGMFHSLNIPAVRLMMQGHGVLYLPTLDRFIHGDHIVAYHDAPAELLLLTADEIRPFAQDESWIYAIVYPDKYHSPLLSMPLYRDGRSLYIHAENVRDPATGTCIQVSAADWARITQQLGAYHLQYDAQSCILTSDRLPILTLDQLADPAP